jgi:hypothetical protein
MKKQIERSLNNIAKPHLQKWGFIYYGKNKFIKKGDSDDDQIIEYQFGKKYLNGIFTVNLICGNKLVRLNMIRPTFLSKVMNRLLGEKETWWKGIFLPKDKWWNISSDQNKTDAIIQKTIIDLDSFGIKYLENI